MKKTILGSCAILACLAMTGCGNNSDESAINSLKTELDRVTNTITQSASIDDAKYTLTDSDLANVSNTSSLSTANKTTKSLLENQEALKNNILNVTAQIKQSLSKDNIKLGNSKVKAIKDLTASLNKYNTNINLSNNELKNSAKSVDKVKSTYKTNAEQVTARLNRLSCSSNTRNCYLQNLLNTLYQVQGILGTTDNGDGTFCLNGICFDANGNCIGGNCYNQYGVLCPNGNCFTQALYDQYGNCINGSCLNNQYGAMYGQNYNFSNSGYCPGGTCEDITGTNPYNNPTTTNTVSQRNMTNNYQNYSSINKKSNIDSYAPRVRNIDTYRNNGYRNGANGNGYGANGYNNGYMYGSNAYRVNDVDNVPVNTDNVTNNPSSQENTSDNLNEIVSLPREVKTRDDNAPSKSQDDNSQINKTTYENARANHPKKNFNNTNSYQGDESKSTKDLANTPKTLEENRDNDDLKNNKGVYQHNKMTRVEDLQKSKQQQNGKNIDKTNNSTSTNEATDESDTSTTSDKKDVTSKKVIDQENKTNNNSRVIRRVVQPNTLNRNNTSAETRQLDVNKNISRLIRG